MRRSHVDKLLYICFFLSGASGLVFEIVWMRKLALVFGNTVHAVSTVVAVFMGGLALGSWLFGRLADRGKRLLRLYVLIEAGIAVFGMTISLGLLPVLDTAYVFLHGVGLSSGVGLFLIRFVLSVLIMLPPTVLMGGTLPVVGRYLVRSRDELGARIGGLYGTNTLGAVVGTLAAGFWLIMLLGEAKTCITAAVCNLVTAALALTVAALAGDRVDQEAAGEDKKKPAYSYPEEKIVWVPWLFAVSGFAALAYEVLWTRALIYFVGLSVHAFTIILACFLAGIAIGSFVATGIVDRSRNLFHLFGALQWLMALSGLLSLPLIGQLNLIFQKLNLMLGANTWAQITLVKFCLCLAVLGLPTLAMGAAFPTVNRIFIRRRSVLGRGVGSLYAANTFGTILGSLCAGFVLLPLFGISGSLIVVALVNMALAVAALRLETAAGRTGPVLNSLGAALALACGLWIYTSGALGPVVRFSLHNSGKQILYVKETTEASLAVLRNTDGNRELNINGESTAYTGFDDIVIHKLLSHLPILFHPDPQNALVVGFGFGSTLYTATLYDLPRVECVELVPEEAATAGFFLPENHGVLDSSGVKIVFNDGRNLILTAGAEYDVISFNAIHPKLSPMLYTLDFYRLCRRALAPAGTVCAWLPTNGLTLTEFKSLLRSFVEVFPNSSLWWCNPANVILLGTTDRLAVNWPRYRGQLAAARIASDLREVKLEHPFSLGGLFMMGPERLRRLTADAPLNTDSKPVIEFSRTMAPTVPLETFYWMMENLEPFSDYFTWNDDIPGKEDSLRVAKEEFGRWFRARRSFYEGKFAAWVFQEPAVSQNFYRRALALNPQDDYIRYFADPRPPDPDSLTALARSDPADFVVRYQLGEYYYGLGDMERARQWYSQVTRLVPDHALAWFQLGVCADQQGRAAESERFFRKALEINPASPQAMVNLGLVRYRAGDLKAAEEYFSRAVAASPGYGAALFNMANLLLRQGRTDDAENLYRETIRLDPFNPLAPLNLGSILTKRGEYPQAIELFKRAVELAPGLVQGYGNLAVAYEKMGDGESAAKYRSIFNRLQAGRSRAEQAR